MALWLFSFNFNDLLITNHFKETIEKKMFILFLFFLFVFGWCVHMKSINKYKKVSNLGLRSIRCELRSDGWWWKSASYHWLRSGLVCSGPVRSLHESILSQSPFVFGEERWEDEFYWFQEFYIDNETFQWLFSIKAKEQRQRWID